jgi:outer membrane protein TolC
LLPPLQPRQKRPTASSRTATRPGLITVTELLRSEAALAAARTRRLAAVYDHRIAAAALEHAAGTLAADSALVN